MTAIFYFRAFEKIDELFFRNGILISHCKFEYSDAENLFRLLSSDRIY